MIKLGERSPDELIAVDLSVTRNQERSLDMRVETSKELRSCNKYKLVDAKVLKDLLIMLKPELAEANLNRARVTKAAILELFAICTGISADSALPSRSRVAIETELTQRKPAWLDRLEVPNPFRLDEFWEKNCWFKLVTVDGTKMCLI